MLLERYARAHLAAASAPQRRLLARLLETPDPDLADWLLGPGHCNDPELASLVAAVRGTPAPADPPAALRAPAGPAAE